jgi:hypothetical protein
VWRRDRLHIAHRIGFRQHCVWRDRPGFSDAKHRWKSGEGWLTPVEYAAAAAKIAANKRRKLTLDLNEKPGDPQIVEHLLLKHRPALKRCHHDQPRLPQTTVPMLGSIRHPSGAVIDQTTHLHLRRVDLLLMIDKDVRH